MLVDVSPQEAQTLAALSVACAALLASWNGAGGGFVWDDRAALLSNADVRADGRGSSLTELFMHDFWGLAIRSASSHKSYRPLTVLSFRLNHLLAGGHDAAAYHTTNTLIHAGCAVLVWKLASVLFAQHYRCLTGSDESVQQASASVSFKDNPQDVEPVVECSAPSSVDEESHSEEVVSPGALAAGLLFAVHPVHCDAVASIVGRADLLCTLLSLSAFLVYVRGAEDKHKNRVKWLMLVLALLLTLTASLCKELGFTTFGLLLVYDLLRLPSHRLADATLRAPKTRVATTVCVGLAAAVLRVWVNGEHRQMEWNILANNVAVIRDAKLVKLLSYAHLHAWYLWKLVWPRWLSFDYGFNTIPVISGLTDPRNVYTLLAYITVAIGSFVALRQFRASPSSSLLLMSIAFGSIPFVPASNVFFPVGTVVAERLLYFPSVGFCLLVGFIIDRALAIMKKHAASDPLNQIDSQRNHTSLFFRSSRRLVQISAALILASGYYRSRVRNLEWASEDALFNAALQVVPTNVKVLSNAAKGLLNSDPQRAIRYLSVALGLLPRHLESHTNMGLAFSTLSKSMAESVGPASNESDALFLHCVRHLYKAVELGPKIYPAPGFLGGELLSHWINTHRDHNRGHSLQQFLASETVTRAAAFLEAAIAANSVYPAHFFHRGNLAYEAGDLDEAIRFLRASEEANSVIRERQLDSELLVEPASIYNMLGVCYKRKREPDEALALLLQAIELYPGEPDLHANAALILHDRGQRQESDQQLRASLLAATDRSGVRKLHHIAQVLEGQHYHGAAQAFLDRAAELQHQFS